MDNLFIRSKSLISAYDRLADDLENDLPLVDLNKRIAGLIIESNQLAQELVAVKDWEKYEQIRQIESDLREIGTQMLIAELRDLAKGQ